VLVGLIGAGIQRSLTPALHEEEAWHHRLRLHYQLIDLDRDADGAATLPTLLRAVRTMGFAGLNITYPCKQTVMPSATERRGVAFGCRARPDRWRAKNLFMICAVPSPI
jgi:shikimate dehydrogenase